MRHFGWLSGADVCHSLSNGADMVRRCAAAAAHNVDEAVNGPLANVFGQHLRSFVIATKGIGKTSVRVCRSVSRADAGKRFNVRTEFLGAQCTV